MSSTDDYELAKKLAQEEQDHQLALKMEQLLKDEEYAKSYQNNPSMLPCDPFSNGITDFLFRLIQNVVVKRVCNMVSDTQSQHLVDKYGLTIDNVTWEDNARYANSVWGPCITGTIVSQSDTNIQDMTLQLQSPSAKLPVIRHPNFTDLTWDVPLDQIPLIVGNEVDKTEEIRYSVTLKEYLTNLRTYLTNPENGPKGSVLKSGENFAVMSSQACFLPVPKNVRNCCKKITYSLKEGSSSKFNVALYHYGSAPILTIVATSKGTSAQIVHPHRGSQELFFNLNGQKCSFIGQKLSAYRKANPNFLALSYHFRKVQFPLREK
jgi:hypothetical protein